MRYLFFIMLIILILSGCKREIDNIEIKSEDLKTAIRKFYKDASYYSKHSINDTISISFYQNKEKNLININMISFQMLEGSEEICIGETKVDNIKVFMYIDKEKIPLIKDLLKINYEKIYSQKYYSDEEIMNGIGYKETYDALYIYKNGIIKQSVFTEN